VDGVFKSPRSIVACQPLQIRNLDTSGVSEMLLVRINVIVGQYSPTNIGMARVTDTTTLHVVPSRVPPFKTVMRPVGPVMSDVIARATADALQLLRHITVVGPSNGSCDGEGVFDLLGVTVLELVGEADRLRVEVTVETGVREPEKETLADLEPVKVRVDV
jgi:hypothetical protein